MRELHLSRLLVVDEQGAAVGLVSVSDLVAPLGRQSGTRRRVSEVMNHAIVMCPVGTPLPAAARAMTDRRSRSIVVVDEQGRAAGVLTGNDLLSLYGAPERYGVVEDLMSAPNSCDPDLPLRAADRAHREIERNLHDGAQHRFVSATLQLHPWRATHRELSDEARAGLDEVLTQLRTGLADLRELAHGLPPAVLSDRGLKGASSSLADHAGVPVELRVALPERRLAMPIDAAAYFTVFDSQPGAGTVLRARLPIGRSRQAPGREMANGG
jgi:CBS domain-containing protein